MLFFHCLPSTSVNRNRLHDYDYKSWERITRKEIENNKNKNDCVRVFVVDEVSERGGDNVPTKFYENISYSEIYKISKEFKGKKGQSKYIFYIVEYENMLIPEPL